MTVTVERRRSIAARGLAATLVCCVGLVFAACSSSPAAVTTSTASTGASTHTVPGTTAELGASLSSWKVAHVPTTAGTTAGYGPIVTVNGRKVPEFTALHVSGGKVVGWHLSFGSATHLAVAENLVRQLLPADAQQTASWRGTFGPGRYCEFVDFRSKALAQTLATAVPPASGSNIGATIYYTSPKQSGTPSIEEVNSADVGIHSHTQGQTC
jgi:hypothetical protein